MRFKDDAEKPDETGRLPGQPHPDAKTNHEFAVYRMKEFEPLDPKKHFDLNVSYSDVDRYGIVIDPVKISFHWRDKGVNYGRPVSFHQGKFEFNKELIGCLEWLEKQGKLKRIIKKKSDYYGS